MSIRTLVPVGAAVLSLCAVSACSSGPGSASGGNSVLRIAASTNEKGALDAAVAEYRKTHPDVDVNVTYAALDQYQTTIRTQLFSGTGPDVMFIWPGDGNPLAMEVVAEAGYLQDLSDRPWATSVPEGIRPVVTQDGKTWIGSVTFSGIGAIYNQQAMESAGLTAPTTWTGLLEFCAAAQDKGKVPFSLGAQTNWVTQLVNYALAPTLVYGPTPDFAQQMADGDATFGDSEWKTTMDKYLQMQDAGCFNDQVLDTNYETTLTQVAKGEALGVIQVNSALAAIKPQAPKGTTFEMQPLPATDDPTQTRMAGAAGASYAVNAKAKQKDAALDFVDWLMSPAGMNFYSTENAALPAIPNDQFTVEPALRVLEQYQKDGRTDPYMDQQWPNARVQQVHFAVVQELLGGKTSPQEALQRMDDAYEQG